MMIRLKTKLCLTPGALVFWLGLFITICTTASFSQPVRFSLPTDAAGLPGETVTIPLNLDPNGQAVGSFDATVEFGKNLLAYTGFSVGSILRARDNWFVDVNANDANGTLVIGAFSFGRVSGAGPAVLLRFAVSAAAVGGDTARFILRGLAATDTNAVSLPVEGRNGKFTIKPTISGRIRTAAGAGLGGVVLSGLPDNLTTEANGDYRVVADPGWSGVLTPQKSGYVFEPPSRQFTNVTRDLPNQDFLAAEAADESFAFPNPFNPQAEAVQIRFALKKPAAASVKILDGRGELVREFVNIAVTVANSAQTVQWDGRNGRGDWVANGVYFYVIEAPANARFVGKIGVAR